MKGLDRRKCVIVPGKFERHLPELLEFVHSALRHLSHADVEIFVDALDEGNHEEVRSVVNHFERSALAAKENGMELKMCWSSRHYPYVRLRRVVGLELQIEGLNGL